MSITHLIRINTIRSAVFRFDSKDCIHGFNKIYGMSTTATAESTPPARPGLFNITENPSIPIPKDTITFTVLDKTNMNLTIDSSASVLEPIPDDAVTKTISFDSIPGPVSLKIIHQMWGMIPRVSSQVAGGAIQYLLEAASLFSWNENVELFKRLFRRYGPVVRLHGLFGGDIVMINRPEDIATILKNDGPYPVYSSLDSIEKYLSQHRTMQNLGPFPMFGPEWETFKESIEESLPQLMAQQFDTVDDICETFVSGISNITDRHGEVPSTFHREIYKWCLECFFVQSFNKRLDFLDPCGLSPTSDVGILLEGLIGATKAIQRCEYGPHLWQFFSTPAWRSLVENCDSIEGILIKYIHRIQCSIKENKGEDGGTQDTNCFMETVYLKQEVMAEDALTLLLDMLLIGVNATTHTVAFLLYHLAKSPRTQTKLYREIMEQPVELSMEALAAMPYLQACIKETLRLKPPIPLLTRNTPNDLLIHNYHVPRGTYVLMVTTLSNLQEEYFEDAHKFMPERWWNAEELQFASIPFGSGPEPCLGKEFAEMQIGALITQILRSYTVEYLYDDIKSSHRLWAAPNTKLRFRFIERS